jgi:hypothetical protein
MANMGSSSPCSSVGTWIFEAGAGASQDLAIEVLRARADCCEWCLYLAPDIQLSPSVGESCV